MKLVEEEIKQPQQSSNLPNQNCQIKDNEFLNPFKTFQRSITLSIIIHFVRFIYVTIIYYFSDIFLTTLKGESQPWNSLIYLLAMMIQIIKFIGDCSLRNLLKNEQKKLKQIHNSRKRSLQTHEINQNIPLKAAKYEDYMFLFSMVRILKYEHKNYSSAFSMSKQLHIVCTFLLFSWMSFRQQTIQQAGWLQFFVLGTFLYSIYFTSFEIDLFMIQNSEGRSLNSSNYQSSALTQTEILNIRRQFHSGRNQHCFFVIAGSITIIIAVIFQFSFNLLAIASLILILINYAVIEMEQKIQTSSWAAIASMKRQTINTYSVLRKSTQNFRIQYQALILVQRAAILWFFFIFAKEINLDSLSFGFYVMGILLLFIGQVKKFKVGNKLKLLAIVQSSYSKSMSSNHDTKLQPQCAICLNPFQQSQKVKSLPCSKDHIYHSVCFDDWKKIKKQCPLCRYSLQDFL